MVEPQQAISYLPPLIAFYDAQEMTAVQVYSPWNRRGASLMEQLVAMCINLRVDASSSLLHNQLFRKTSKLH